MASGVALGNWLLPEGYMWQFDGARGDRARRIEAWVSELIGEQNAQAFRRDWRDSFVTEADIVRIAELGFNHVRVAMNARLLLPEGKDAFDEQEFAYLTTVVQWCKNHQVYVTLDMHGAPGGQTGKNIDDSPNDYPDLFTDLFESNDIGWCCWTWKKLEGYDNPYGYATPGDWWQVQNYVKDASQKPSASVAQGAFDQLIDSIRFANNWQNTEPICSILPCP